MLIPPVAHPNVIRAPFSAAIPYQFFSGAGFSCDDRRLPQLDSSGAREVMDLQTGRVGHNMICSHSGWTTSGNLDNRRCSMVGFQLTIAHARPLGFWIDAHREVAAHGASGNVPFWGSANTAQSTFLVAEVYVLGEPAGSPTFSLWSPQTNQTFTNPGAPQGTRAGATSVRLDVPNGPTLPIGTQVFVMAGVGSRHIIAASNADITSSIVHIWTIDSISYYP